jgi:Ca2+-binding EF-hand superfamily protein
LDANADGTIDRIELKTLASALGEPLTDDDIDAAYQEMDSRKTGRVRQHHFPSSRTISLHHSHCPISSLVVLI